MLYVDDEPALLDVTRLFLEKTKKFNIATEESAKSALRLLKAQQFDVIVADYQMPGMDGIEFLRQVRADYGEIPFILFTGKGREDVAIDAINNGADSYLQKGGTVHAQFAVLAKKILVLAERSRARMMLRETEKKYKMLFENVSEGIFMADMNRRIVEANASACRQLGYQCNELIGMTLDQITDSSASQLQQRLQEVQEHGATTFRSSHRHKHGHMVPVEIRVTYMECQGQKFFLGYSHEITNFVQSQDDFGPSTDHNIRANEKLPNHDASHLKRQKSLKDEARYKALFESAGEAIMVLRLDEGRILCDDANNRAVSLFGITKNDLLATDPVSLSPKFQPEGSASKVVFEENVRRAMDGETVLMEWVHYRNDGTLFPCEVTLARIDAGNEILIQDIVRDITKHKRVIDALSLENRKFSLMAAITLHDIRNKIMVLLTYLELSKELTQDPELLQFMHKEIDTIKSIECQIESAKEYQDTGKNEPQWQNLSLIVNQVAGRFEMEKIHLEICIDKVLEVFADPMLENVFYNLFQNTLLHGVSPGRISVTSLKEPDKLIITVQDDGGGIEPDKKEMIFIPGYGSNTGLGLFLIREILNITGITICETGIFGEGARFEIRVPVSSFRMK